MLRNRANLAREQKSMSHPNDRRVRQLEKKQKRNDKALNSKDKLKVEKAQKVVRFFWFREQCVSLSYTTQPVSEETIHTLTQIHIDRNVAEIAELKKVRNPAVGRIRQLEALREMELEAYRSSKGIEVPNLLDADNVEVLTKMWDGESDTVMVVTGMHLTLGRRSLASAGEIAALQERLKPIEEIREQSTSILPKRALRFHAKGKEIMIAAATAAATAKKAARNTSVKKIDTSLKATQQRIKDAGVKQQQARLKERRNAVLALKRE